MRRRVYCRALTATGEPLPCRDNLPAATGQSPCRMDGHLLVPVVVVLSLQHASNRISALPILSRVFSAPIQPVACPEPHHHFTRGLSAGLDPCHSARSDAYRELERLPDKRGLNRVGNIPRRPWKRKRPQGSNVVTRESKLGGGKKGGVYGYLVQQPSHPGPALFCSPFRLDQGAPSPTETPSRFIESETKSKQCRTPVMVATCSGPIHLHRLSPPSANRVRARTSHRLFLVCCSRQLPVFHCQTPPAGHLCGVWPPRLNYDGKRRLGEDVVAAVEPSLARRVSNYVARKLGKRIISAQPHRRT